MDTSWIEVLKLKITEIAESLGYEIDRRRGLAQELANPKFDPQELLDWVKETYISWGFKCSLPKSSKKKSRK
jgi:hypothetical protein